MGEFEVNGTDEQKQHLRFSIRNIDVLQDLGKTFRTEKITVKHFG